MILKKCYITQPNYKKNTAFTTNQGSETTNIILLFFTYVDICLGVSSHHLCDIQSLNHILLTTSSEAKGVFDRSVHSFARQQSSPWLSLFANKQIMKCTKYMEGGDLVVVHI